MLELIELLAGVVIAIGVIAGGWLAVSLILTRSGSGAEAMTEMLKADGLHNDDLSDRPLQESAVSV